MKSIKIKPLTFAEDLRIPTNQVTHYNITDPEKAKEVMEKLQNFVSQYKNTNLFIQAKSLKGIDTPAITTNIKTKDGNTFQFPEPNPVHLYFQNSCNHLTASLTLLKDLKQYNSIDHEKQYAVFLKYFHEITTGITLLVMSVETFINQHIPETIVLEMGENTHWNKPIIERKSLKIKIKEIIPKIYGVNFYLQNEVDYIYLIEVQDLRNDLVHLKTVQKSNKTFYEDLIKRLLEFEPEKYVNAVFKFLNCLNAGYIEEEL